MTRRNNRFSRGLLLIGVVVSFIAFSLSREFEKFTPEFKISAAKLHYVYSTDEENANEVFLNKRICVVGKLLKVEVDENGDTVLTLDTNESRRVRCIMSSDEDQSAQGLEVGMKVEIKGLCAGYISGVVMLDCTLA